MTPDDLIAAHFRLTKTQLAALKRLGLVTLADLLRHFPARYESTAGAARVADVAAGTRVTLYGTLSKLEAKRLWKSRKPATEGWFEDGSGRIKVRWFNQPYMARYVPQGSVVKLTGAISGAQSPYITNPEVEAVPPEVLDELPGHLGASENTNEDATPFPVYPESRGITSRWFFHAAEKLFGAGVHEQLPDPVPADVRTRLRLPSLAHALVAAHAPKTERDAQAARKRFSFEEIFVIQTAKHLERAANDAQRAHTINAETSRIDAFIAALPFTLTGAQRRAIDAILADMARPRPMARLLEGDVGSGKTAVAATTAYAAVTSTPAGRESGSLQVAYMAPTEILATQHFYSFIELFADLPINIGLITGSGCLKFPSKVRGGKPTSISRAQLSRWMANGEIALVVGTHALIQKSVQFKYLAYAIVDEQHRFGTEQRRKLAHKNTDGAEMLPHFLSMTATPIPRTLALTTYGDLDISVLDELPPDRAPVSTRIVPPEKRDSAYEAVRRELAHGRQAYVICPRIDEPDPAKELALRATAATSEAERLARDVFPEAAVGLLHGKLTPAEKEDVMQRFASGAIDVLVATSVVEVGVNVPNATTIVIEGAERFGLAQLHQLRGRVQRSAHDAQCFLFTDTKNAAPRERLAALEKSADGFALAEADLEQRGAGDLYGRKQWGVSDIGMDALKNIRLIEAARSEAAAMVAADPTLTHHPELAKRIAAVNESLHKE